MYRISEYDGTKAVKLSAGITVSKSDAAQYTRWMAKEAFRLFEKPKKFLILGGGLGGLTGVLWGQAIHENPLNHNKIHIDVLENNPVMLQHMEQYPCATVHNVNAFDYVLNTKEKYDVALYDLYYTGADLIFPKDPNVWSKLFEISKGVVFNVCASKKDIHYLISLAHQYKMGQIHAFRSASDYGKDLSFSTSSILTMTKDIIYYTYSRDVANASWENRFRLDYNYGTIYNENKYYKTDKVKICDKYFKDILKG